MSENTIRLGKLTGEEIMEILGIKRNTYIKDPRTHQKKLEYFCDYTPVWGGIVVNEVYVEKYVKNAFDIDCKNLLSLLKGCKCQMFKRERFIQVFSGLPEYKDSSTKEIEYRFEKAFEYLLGTYRESGTAGEYIMTEAIKVDNDTYRSMTMNERVDYDTIVAEYNRTHLDQWKQDFIYEMLFYGNKDDSGKARSAAWGDIAEVMDMDQDEVTEQEYYKHKIKNDLDVAYRKLFKQKTGLTIDVVYLFRLNKPTDKSKAKQ